MNGFLKNILPPFVTKFATDGWGSGGAGVGEVNGVQGGMSVRSVEAVAKTLSPTDAYALNIVVNAAVNCITQNISKAKPRLFTRSGEEVFSGPAYELMQKPNPNQGFAKFISDWVSWYNIQGELASLKRFTSDGQLSELRNLFPQRLQIWPQGQLYKGRDDITSWLYYWNDGTTTTIPNAALVFNSTLNPSDPVRGLAPPSVGAVQIGVLHWAGQYNLTAFQNGGIPSHLVVLPEGTPRKERDDFQRRYLAEYNRYNHNSHKVMVVSGGNVKVETLEKDNKSGEYIPLQKMYEQEVAMLYRVPAVEIGLFSESRFNTATEERSLFLESTLLPQIEMLTTVWQHQILDPHFRFSSASDKRKAKMTKAMSERFDQARAATSSDLVFLLDPDTLPIMHKVRVSLAAGITSFRQATATSPAFATEYFGIDVEDDRPERKDIYLLATERNISHPEKNVEIMAAQAKADANPPTGDSKPAKTADKGIVQVDAIVSPTAPVRPAKAIVEPVRLYIRELRRLTLQSADSKAMWTLSEADKMAGGLDVSLDIRKSYHATRKMVLEGDADGIRTYFNAIKPADWVK